MHCFISPRTIVCQQYVYVLPPCNASFFSDDDEDNDGDDADVDSAASASRFSSSHLQEPNVAIESEAMAQVADLVPHELACLSQECPHWFNLPTANASCG
ncbi:hypothetical protein PC121_g6400 [Phytophthora cactorum]|nr:hypothetical protein PC120_g4611 [Phytophthora cactorum]KAG3081666.1 hypothetical protein PC121_g6400 [Phytophthora cactorum]